MATTGDDDKHSKAATSQAAAAEPMKKPLTDAIEDQPQILYWKLAREGVSLLLNNKQEQAEALFKAHPDSLEMCTGHVYAVFIDALMTFEDDKIQQSLQCMKDLEKKCAAHYNYGWFRMVKSKVFGSDPSTSQKELECQIILADTHAFVAMLTFLQQDITGFIKGSWILRKSYKYYQSAYNSIRELYKEIVGDENVPCISEPLVPMTHPPPAGSAIETAQNLDICQSQRKSSAEVVELASGMEVREPIDAESTEGGQHSTTTDENPIQQTNPTKTVQETNFQNEQPSDLNSDASKVETVDPVADTSALKNGYTALISPSLRSHPKHSISYHTGLSSYTSKFRKNGYVPPKQRDAVASDEERFRPSMKKSTSTNSGLSKKLRGSSAFSPTSSSYFNLRSFGIFDYASAKDMDKDAISRLMCAVSFGYGLLQLGISLLPPTMLKVVNFFGFSGNRKIGIENLMYARKGDDLRAPFATLALLWYHTIVRPFFALDGTNFHSGVQAAADLIEEMEPEFAESALFLFFRGRVERLRSEIGPAINTFQAAITNAAQKEIKLMSMHEVGWCYLIELNFTSAETAFQYLKEQSRWSKPFYSYLCLISAGSNHMFQEVQNAKELRDGFLPVVKGTQLDEFLMRRYKICPLDEESLRRLNFIFWKLLSYELLYLWNTLPCCNPQSINRIIKDCHEAWTLGVEPFLGLSRLVEGSCQCILGRYEEGIKCFHQGIKARNGLPNNVDDAHVSAFTNYELGLVLIKSSETLTEGKQFLEFASSIYKGYDFEQRLTVRAHTVLKNL